MRARGMPTGSGRPAYQGRTFDVTTRLTTEEGAERELIACGAGDLSNLHAASLVSLMRAPEFLGGRKSRGTTALTSVASASQFSAAS